MRLNTLEKSLENTHRVKRTPATHEWARTMIAECRATMNSDTIGNCEKWQPWSSWPVVLPFSSYHCSLGPRVETFPTLVAATLPTSVLANTLFPCDLRVSGTPWQSAPVPPESTSSAVSLFLSVRACDLHCLPKFPFSAPHRRKKTC